MMIPTPGFGWIGHTDTPPERQDHDGGLNFMDCTPLRSDFIIVWFGCSTASKFSGHFSARSGRDGEAHSTNLVCFYP